MSSSNGLRSSAQRPHSRGSLHGELTVLLSLLFAQACTPSRGFQCGEPLATDEAVIRTCNRPHESCICATNSCAAPDDTCESGLRYVGEPFALPEIEKACVPTADSKALIGPRMSLRCPAGPADAAANGDSKDGES